MPVNIIKPAERKGKVYQNPVPTAMMAPGSFWKVLWLYLTTRAERVPKIPPGPFVTPLDIFNQPSTSGLRITWMGHSSILIEIDGARILTDPVWSPRASFSNIIGPKRFFNPPIALEDLPSIDCVLISHDHYDHLDEQAIRILNERPVPFICPPGVEKHLEKWGVRSSNISILNWSDDVTLRKGTHITAMPTRHFSGRGITNRNQTLWASFVIEGSKHRIYYGADSGWFEGFESIGEAFGPFDLTMLEIGAFHPYWSQIHMGPVGAADAHLALKGKIMMPIHWGLFNLALHAWREPVNDIIELAKEKNITLFLPVPGMPTEVEPLISNWWDK